MDKGMFENGKKKMNEIKMVRRKEKVGKKREKNIRDLKIEKTTSRKL